MSLIKIEVAVFVEIVKSADVKCGSLAHLPLSCALLLQFEEIELRRNASVKYVQNVSRAGYQMQNWTPA